MAFQRIVKAADLTLTAAVSAACVSSVIRLGDEWVNKKRIVEIQLTPEKDQVIVVPIPFFGAKVVTFVEKGDYRKVEWYWRPTKFFVEKDGKTVVIST